MTLALVVVVKSLRNVVYLGVDMSFGGELPKRREYMWGKKPHIMIFFEKERQIKDHFDILHRALNNMEDAAWGQENSSMLDHTNHIRTEVERLKKCLDI